MNPPLPVLSSTLRSALIHKVSRVFYFRSFGLSSSVCLGDLTLIADCSFKQIRSWPVLKKGDLSPHLHHNLLRSTGV